MSAFQIPYDRCATPGCAVRPLTWSRYCTKCTARRQRYGHVASLTIRRVDLLRHRDPIGHALASLERAPAVVAADAEAQRLLNYRAPHGAPRHMRELEEQMQRLRSRDTTPRELVQRVCQVFYLDHDGTFQDVRACQFALARQVLLIRSMNRYRPGARLLASLGVLLHGHFAVFALKLRKETNDDAEAARQRRADMANGWTVPADSDDE